MLVLLRAVVLPPQGCIDSPHLPEILLCEDAEDERLQTALAVVHALGAPTECESRGAAAGCARFIKLIHPAIRESSDEKRP